MIIYGVALLSFCFLVGLVTGELIGVAIGAEANVGGVGIAMLLLIVLANLSRHEFHLSKPTESGITFWSAMYIPIVVAMAGRQNVMAAVSSGWLAVIAGVAGALYYPQAGIINPAEIAPIASIYLAVWVAIGGRGRLYGAVIGAAFVSLLSTWFTGGQAPDIDLGFYRIQWVDWWIVLLGLSFVAVTLFAPKGIGGLFDLIDDIRSRAGDDTAYTGFGFSPGFRLGLA